MQIKLICRPGLCNKHTVNKALITLKCAFKQDMITCINHISYVNIRSLETITSFYSSVKLFCTTCNIRYINIFLNRLTVAMHVGFHIKYPFKPRTHFKYGVSRLKGISNKRMKPDRGTNSIDLFCL